MAGKIINTLKYGDRKTKGKLYLLFGILAAGVVVLLLALILSSMALGVLAFLALLVDGLVLMNTAFGTKEISMKQIKPSSGEKETEDKDIPGALEWISSEQTEKEKKEEEASVKNPLISYDEKKLKKVMYAYKVKREHVPIMIEYCQAEGISQCPAYAWRDSKYIYFLLLEQEARMIKAELSGIDGIHIRRGMTARPSTEYTNMQEKSLVSKLFSEYLPNYYQASDGRRIEFKKNLYSAAPGVWCTASSVKNLLKLFHGHFILDNNNVSDENDYYKEIYITRILFWDKVYTPSEYKEKVIATLRNLAEANISVDTFNEYLAEMLIKGLIPQEYADFAINRRAVK